MSSSSSSFPSGKYRSKWGHYYIPVQFWNRETDKAVTIQMEVDTGAQHSIIGSTEVQKIGIDIEDGDGPYDWGAGPFEFSGTRAHYYWHELDLRIGGKLPWIKQWMKVVDRPLDGAVLGWEDILNKYRWNFSTTGLTVEKYATSIVKFKKGTIDGYIIVYNVENGKEVKVPVTVDTGATHTTIDNKYLRLLGINEETKKKLKPVSYTITESNWFEGPLLAKPIKRTGYYLETKLGEKLKSVMLPIWFDDLKDWDGVGMLAIAFIMSKNKYNISFEKDRVKYEEVYYGTAGVSNSARNYRRRYI